MGSDRMEQRKRFGEFVRSMRHQKGLSIKGLAVALGYDTRGMITGVESGNAPIPIEQIHPLSKALGLPVERILEKLKECEPELFRRYMILEADITEDFRKKVLGRSSLANHEAAAHHVGQKLTSLYIIRTSPMVQLSFDLRETARFSHDTRQKTLVFSHARSSGTQRLRIVRSRKNGKLPLAA